jgi:allophanate hydrolase subunit 1
MTRVQIHFRLQKPLDSATLSKLAGTHTLYGIQKVSVADDSLTVEYDASRLRPAEVEAALAAAGVCATSSQTATPPSQIPPR